MQASNSWLAFTITLVITAWFVALVVLFPPNARIISLVPRLVFCPDKRLVRRDDHTSVVRCLRQLLTAVVVFHANIDCDFRIIRPSCRYVLGDFSAFQGCTGLLLIFPVVVDDHSNGFVAPVRNVYYFREFTFHELFYYAERRFHDWIFKYQMRNWVNKFTICALADVFLNQ